MSLYNVFITFNMDVLARNLFCIKRTKLKPTDLDFFDIFN